MATLEEIIDNIDIPLPASDGAGNGEPIESWARRIAYIGALAGKQHTLAHTPPIVIKVPVMVVAEPPPPAEPAVEDAVDDKV